MRGGYAMARAPVAQILRTAIVAVAFLSSLAALARTPSEAKNKVQSWIDEHSHGFGMDMGSPSGEVFTANANGTNFFHIVTLSDGGFVAMADSDGVVLAFSDSGSVSDTNAAPLWAMLLADTGAAPRRSLESPPILKADSDGAPVLPEGVSISRTTVQTLPFLKSSVSSESSIDDLRVPVLMGSTWDQKTAGGKKVYNYYTPGNVYCGCVATAMSQVMRYHEYPTGSVASKTKLCLYEGFQTNLTIQGGTYDWSLMPLSPDSSISTSEQQAIGKLTSDAGISVHMQYSSSGSGASGLVAAYAFTNTWGYAQAQYWLNSSSSGSAEDGYLDAEALEDTILANLDAGQPCLLGVTTASGDSGHAIVADGYGYISTQRYVHINMGWSGYYNYWYNFPISAGGYTFSSLAEVIYNISPSESGNIVSGRITSTNGVALAGATVDWCGYLTTRKGPKKSYTALSGSTTTSDYGIYSFFVDNGSVSITNITVSLTGYEPSETNGVSTSTTVSYVLAASYIDADPTDIRYYTTTPSIGNSWGNDLTLSAYYIDPSFKASPALSATDGTLTLVMSATVGTVWNLQWNDDLSNDDGWTTLGAYIATGEALAIVLDSSVFDWTAHPQAFFRLVSAE